MTLFKDFQLKPICVLNMEVNKLLFRYAVEGIYFEINMFIIL